MAKIPPIAYIAGAGLLGLGAWFFFLRGDSEEFSIPQSQQNYEQSRVPEPLPSTTSADALVKQWNIAPTTVSGSTSLAGLATYLEEFGVTYEAKSSSVGIQELLRGQVGIAAISRPLTADEQFQGLIAHEIGQDALAFVVPNQTAAPQNVSRQQIQGILAGNISNWSEVSGQNASIDLVVRGEGGTYDSVQNLFGLPKFSPSATYMSVDSTTQMLNTLNSNSVGFATATQVCDQSKFQSLLVDGLEISDPNYYPQRGVFFVTKGQPNENQRKVIDLARFIFSEELVASSVCR